MHSVTAPLGAQVIHRRTKHAGHGDATDDDADGERTGQPERRPIRHDPLLTKSPNTPADVGMPGPNRANHSLTHSPSRPVTLPSPYTRAGCPVALLMMMNAMS